jgi:hypothetical protein
VRLPAVYALTVKWIGSLSGGVLVLYASLAPGAAARAEPSASAARLKPTCRTIESSSCPVESVVLELPSDATPSGAVAVRCVLDSTGIPESCRSAWPSPNERAIVEALGKRRYEPVPFQGKAVPVPYVFMV